MVFKVGWIKLSCHRLKEASPAYRRKEAETISREPKTFHRVYQASYPAASASAPQCGAVVSPTGDARGDGIADADRASGHGERCPERWSLTEHRRRLGRRPATGPAHL